MLSAVSQLSHSTLSFIACILHNWQGYGKKRKNRSNISLARLILIKPFSIRWFDTRKDFSSKELTRQIIPDKFLRKPPGPPKNGSFLSLLTQLVNNNWKIDNWIILFNEYLMSWFGTLGGWIQACQYIYKYFLMFIQCTTSFYIEKLLSLHSFRILEILWARILIFFRKGFW